MNLAAARFAARQYLAALSEYEKALQLRPGNLSIRERLARAQRATRAAIFPEGP
jgi:hypothetical protein